MCRWLYSVPCLRRTWVTWKEHQSWLPIWSCCPSSSSSSLAWSAELSIQVRAQTCGLSRTHSHTYTHLLIGTKVGHVYRMQAGSGLLWQHWGNTPVFSGSWLKRASESFWKLSCELSRDKCFFLFNLRSCSCHEFSWVISEGFKDRDKHCVSICLSVLSRLHRKTCYINN